MDGTAVFERLFIVKFINASLDVDLSLKEAIYCVIFALLISFLVKSSQYRHNLTFILVICSIL